MDSHARSSRTALVILMTSLMPLGGATGQVAARNRAAPSAAASPGALDRLTVVERGQAFTIAPRTALDRTDHGPRPRTVALGAAVNLDMPLAAAALSARSLGALASEDVPCGQEDAHAARR